MGMIVFRRPSRGEEHGTLLGQGVGGREPGRTLSSHIDITGILVGRFLRKNDNVHSFIDIA